MVPKSVRDPSDHQGMHSWFMVLKKLGSEEDAMWHSSMGNSIRSKHKPLINVRTVQWILLTCPYYTNKQSSLYCKFPCQILSPFFDDAGLPAQQISSFQWYLSYHVSKFTALLENVWRHPQQHTETCNVPVLKHNTLQCKMSPPVTCCNM